MLKKIFILTGAALIAVPMALQAQIKPVPAKKVNPNPYGSGMGMNVALTNSGFGLGAYLLRSLGQTTSFTADFMIAALKDEREQRLFGYFGDSIVPYKNQYLHILPVQFGIQKRLFKESIEENFRPFLHFAGGPTFAWASPYFVDTNLNGYRDNFEQPLDFFSAIPKGHAEFGFGGTIAIGAHFGVSKKSTQGIRFGFSFDYFPDGIQMLEPRVKEPTIFFGTPTLTLTFGKLN